MRLVLTKGRVLLPEGGFEEATVVVEEGRIAEVRDNAPAGGQVIDAGGLFVLPGIVDLHGDAFERQLMPRSGVFFPHDLALLETDRQLVANGITTAYHGLTWSWEPGLRGREAALRFMDEFAAARALLACDTRLHLRFEVQALDDVHDVAGLIAAGRVDLLGFNDHIELMTRKLDNYDKMSGYLARSGLDRAGFVARLEAARARNPEVPAGLARLAAAARAAGLPMASHDDPDPEVRRAFHALGATLSEFPLSIETAAAAAEAGDAVILGAPNALRGRSHDKRLTVSEAVACGLCHVLTSDYYYPALLQAPFCLDRGGAMPLDAAWRLVSENPARAAGLTDRGRIAPGQRADLVLVDASAPLPRTAMVIIAGRPAFAAPSLLAGGLVPSS